MIQIIILSSLVAVLNAACYDANIWRVKLKPGDFGVSDYKADFETARKKCESIDGRLINVDSKEKLDAANKCFTEKFGDITIAWTGAVFDYGEWKWSNGKKIEEVYCLDEADVEASGPSGFGGVILADMHPKEPCVWLFVVKALAHQYICESKSG